MYVSRGNSNCDLPDIENHDCIAQEITSTRISINTTAANIAVPGSRSTEYKQAGNVNVAYNEEDLHVIHGQIW